MQLATRSRRTVAKGSRSSHRRPPRVVEPLERRDLMAADPLVFDSNSTSWYSDRDLTSTQWNDVFAERRDDYIPLDIEIADVSGSARIGALWQENTDDRGWAL